MSERTDVSCLEVLLFLVMLAVMGCCQSLKKIADRMEPAQIEETLTRDHD